MAKHPQQFLFENRRLATIMTVLLFTVMFLMPGYAQASALEDMAPLVVTVPGGGSVDIAVNGFCLNRGAPFPGATLNFEEGAPDSVQAAIGYSLEKDYVSSNLYGVQLAVWSLVNGPNPVGYISSDRKSVV